MSRQVKTKVCPLKWVYITGEGRNNAMPGEEPRMQYSASVVMKKDSPEYKFLKEQIDAEWKEYKEKFGVKGAPKTNGLKPIMIDDPKGTIDPETEEVKKIDSGDVLATFKTNTKWPDGKDKIINIYDGKGKDITEAIRAADWFIGDGSTGVIHGTAAANNIGGTHKVTLYLNAVQLAKLVKGTGGGVAPDVIDDAEDIDLGDNGMTALDETDTPEI